MKDLVKNYFKSPIDLILTSAIVSTILLGTLIFYPSGLSKSNVPAYQNRVDYIKREGTPKELTLRLEDASGEDLGAPEIRFYDYDGDRKTVEQYVRIGYAGERVTTHWNLEENLIRPGVKKPLYDPRNTSKKQRTMTNEEMEKLDAQYQNLLTLEGFDNSLELNVEK